jgi:MEDS: MEthanogen/methylotroph, DcmR Sensory domain
MSGGIAQVASEPRAHAVQFYGTDDELAETVGGYLAEALNGGDSVVVVATMAHSRAFEARMAAAGADVAAARATGAFLTLDAAETMHRFLVGDRPDPGGFELVIGGLIQQAAATGRPVRVYGEMVALLWGAGQVNAALELEALWNGLARRLPFSLLCAYPEQSVSGDEHAAALDEVCRLHSAVAGRPPAARARGAAADRTAVAERSFVKDLGAPTAARRFVLETVGPWADRAFAGDAAILATELASNAVLHAQSGFTVAITRSAADLRIAVRDDSPVPLAGNGSPLVVRHGHGLGLVATIASRWAVESEPGGKTVWAELQVPQTRHG